MQLSGTLTQSRFYVHRSPPPHVPVGLHIREVHAEDQPSPFMVASVLRLPPPVILLFSVSAERSPRCLVRGQGTLERVGNNARERSFGKRNISRTSPCCLPRSSGRLAVSFLKRRSPFPRCSTPLVLLCMSLREDPPQGVGGRRTAG